MNPDRVEHLRSWYRDALASRVAALESRLSGVAAGEPDAVAEAEAVAHDLRGSGGTFGFHEVSAAAQLVEEAQGPALLPRLLGLIALLRDIAADGDRGLTDRPSAWLLFAAGLVAPGEELPEEWSEIAHAPTSEAWSLLADELDIDDAEIAERVAARLGLEVPGLSEPRNAATLLVSPALVERHGILPLREDGVRIFAAASDPTDIRAMAALERSTGRSAVLHVTPPSQLRPAIERVYGTFRTPRGEAPEPTVELDTGSDRRREEREGTVLVVDDDAASRMICRSLLEKNGYRVREAVDGREGLAELREDGSVELAVVDLEMPVMGGRELVRRMGKDPELARVPVIILTSETAEGTEADLMEEGAADYLRKPLDPRVFLARVTATLRRVEARSTP